MVSRRSVIAGAGAFGAATLASGCTAAAQDVKAGYAPPPPPKDLTPAQALELLEIGNADFLAGRTSSVVTGPERRMELANGQNPFATIVGCSDSRVPPELLFSRGLGELFLIRNAGNTVDTQALGSIEYGVAVLKTPLVVVMGHEGCGAVKAASEVVTDNATFPGAIGDMVEPIIPAVLRARNEPGDLVENSIRQNVRRVVDGLRNRSDPIMLDPQEEGKLWVVGAYYDLDRGVVDFFDLPPQAG